MRNRASAAFVGLVGVLALGLAAAASAVTISITDATPTYTVTENPCPPHPAAPTSACGVVAHLFTTPVDFDDNYVFDAAWAAWNALQPVAEQWTLVDGGALAATLNVSQFDAASAHGNHGVGGLDITIDLVYDGVDRDDFVWSQGLLTNYLLDGSIVAAFPEMDVASDCTPVNVFCEPVYPFQYNDEHFFDGPRAPYDTGFFEADAFLSKVNYTTRTLTIYEGVHYGFYLWAIPEPGTGLVMIVGLVVLGGWRRLQRAA